MSKFDAIRRADKARQSKPASAEDAPRRGRPQGKRSDPDYTQVTAYVLKDTYKGVQKALLDDEVEFSELVQELLAQWLKSRR